MTNHIHRIRHVVEATTPRWTFEGGMREAAGEALVLQRYEAEEQMEQSLYRHFPSRTTPVGESFMWLWKKHKKLMMLSLVCFSSMTLL
jgi:hypothetical protein